MGATGGLAAGGGDLGGEAPPWLGALVQRLDHLRKALRADIASVRGELGGEIHALRESHEALRTDVHAEVTALRESHEALRRDVRAEVGGVRAEVAGLRESHEALRRDVHAEVGRVRAEVAGVPESHEALRRDIHGQFGSVREEARSGISEVRRELDTTRQLSFGLILLALLGILVKLFLPGA